MPTTRGMMVHLCTLRRYTRTGADGWGDDVRSSTDIPNVKCRFWFEKGQTVVDEGRRIDLTHRKLVVPLSVDVDEDDEIVSVTDRLGNVVADGPMRVDSVGRRLDHRVLTLVDVR